MTEIYASDFSFFRIFLKYFSDSVVIYNIPTKQKQKMTLLQKHLIFVPLCLIVFATVFGWIVMLLWNWLMPQIFGLPVISFWQAVGLLVLCKILFGNVGGHHGHHGMCHGERNKLRERWERMSPEERQRIMDMHKGIGGLDESATDEK